jgi:hypothetical protein
MFCRYSVFFSILPKRELTLVRGIFSVKGQQVEKNRGNSEIFRQTEGIPLFQAVMASAA